MNIKKCLVPVLLFTGLLGQAARADPVVASFQRLLEHQPTATAPAIPRGLGTDPLRSSVSVVLWEKLEPSFHTLAKLIVDSPRPASRN